uniref:Ubiquitin-like domain-containing protein n=1 Tax=Chromera velia CCMP2878 TaxID=1169474 RepID=A0A0G4HDH6_9ALVE
MSESVPASSSSANDIEVTIDDLSGLRKTLVLSPESTVGDLRQKVAASLRVDGSDVLLRAGRVFVLNEKDAEPIGLFGIQKGSVVVFTLRSRGAFQVFVKFLSGKECTVMVTGGQTVAHMKRLLEYQEGLQPADVRIVFGGKELEEEEVLEKAGLSRESSVHVVTRVQT